MESSTPCYRYPGVKPFTIEEKDLFFGRDQDIENLFSLIFVKQTVVLYGKSGYGKSSLINAGIIPRLQSDTRAVYFPIRFKNYSEKEESEILSPAETVQRRLSSGLQNAPSPLDALLPQEESFWYWLKTYQWQQQRTEFILFFDQFEELFTYPKDQVSDFSEQLAQMLYPTIPLSFRQRMMSMDEADRLDDRIQDFLYQKPDIKVVFSVRSDRLSLLNTLTDRHPTILQHCYELDALSPEEAQRAIAQPARLSQQTMGFASAAFTYADEGMAAILKGISNPKDKKIEASTLQIVCRRVEEKLVIDRGETHIDLDNLGPVSEIFRKHYEEVLARLAPDERAKTQQLIEDELIENGRRNTLTDSTIQSRLGIAPTLLQILEQTYLLRKESDAAGRLLYEISHDTLVEPIGEVAVARRAEQAEAQRKAREKLESARKKQLEQDLAEEQKRAETLQKLTDRAVFRSRLALAFALAAVAIAGAAGYFWFQSQRATQYATENAQYLSIALDQVNLQKVRALQETGQRYEEYDEYDLAMRAYQTADSLVSDIQTQRIATIIRNRAPATAVSELDLLTLKANLGTRIATCRQKLAK
ncbi:nSTAND1 domain-containing NTPase [Dyadobacter fanqingshengii]|uniref:Novel STAND NTPase 1 domain-containing protein n=1 Tax=Dyadobacter fanqingshengii TaxID=2906443 RepID=A0A9X1P9V6_9BACT|nr:hypothetical protein [Dyadobacter fanqingshengii]MCF0039743.1 hypothetical protein [Dyadobacter fanqingshengii]USJ38495.1 hypothetical protein NFI81_12080 [Dyadobacter fanqingshengii]